MNKTPLWNYPWLLSIASAVLLSLSFPPIDVSILQIPAFVLLLRLAQITDTPRQLIYYAYPSFVLWNLLTTYWLMMATVAGGLAAILANAALMLIPLVLIQKTVELSVHPFLKSLFIAGFWVAYEFLHHNWDLSWPWLTLGNGWANLTGVIQYISATGVLGITFWVVLSAALFFFYIQKPAKNNLYTALAVFFLFPAASIISMAGLSGYETGDEIKTVIIQPNSDSSQSFGGHDSFEDLINHLLQLSSNAVKPDTDVIIWPENAIDSPITLENRAIRQIRDSLSVWETSLITGSAYVEYFNENNKPPVARQLTDEQYYIVYNAAFALRHDEEPVIYKKGKLVPIIERIPFEDFFNRIDVFGWVDWGSLMQFGLGREENIFSIRGEGTPALICYDSVFPGHVNRFVENGATFLTIVTNDGWWGDSFGHKQHFAYARLRAIEQRMWIARSANNGISGVISPDGKVQLATEYWTEAAFPFTIYSSTERTIYARFGDWTGWIAIILSISGLIVSWTKRE